ncbi:putative DsbA family dithiol-disulfide isomerase [Paucimonas lemoignei]|uniref:Putative DsbA family dithiol-disulfide isomerase n=1 Tax=Paucimonas lemoignei TaxID=29443 RepID=A0A4R3HSV2_PAULE|nr:putative DsbA family dithiol-disulfide isomerase [Paucimonas lemoignei]
MQQAIHSLGDQIEVDLHFQPFELNPAMPSEGQDLDEHLAEKYGLPPEQLERNREAIRARGEQVGFAFNMDKRSRIYNTFDAHRLLHWAGLEGKQLELERALFEAYFTEGENPGAHDLLVRMAGKVGLDQERAREILASNAYADEVRQRQAYYQQLGIHSVPSIIINERHLIQGGQPQEVFAQALQQIAASS